MRLNNEIRWFNQVRAGLALNLYEKRYVQCEKIATCDALLSNLSNDANTSLDGVNDGWLHSDRPDFLSHSGKMAVELVEINDGKVTRKGSTKTSNAVNTLREEGLDPDTLIASFGHAHGGSYDGFISHTMSSVKKHGEKYHAYKGNVPSDYGIYLLVIDTSNVYLYDNHPFEFYRDRKLKDVFDSCSQFDGVLWLRLMDKKLYLFDKNSIENIRYKNFKSDRIKPQLRADSRRDFLLD